MNKPDTTVRTTRALAKIKNGKLEEAFVVPSSMNSAFAALARARAQKHRKGNSLPTLKRNVQDLLAAIDTIDRDNGNDPDRAA